MITSIDAVDLCAAVYQGAAGFDHFEPGTGDDGVCYGIKRIGDTDIVVLRGSRSLLDWRRDLDAWADPFTHNGLGPVHPGFFAGMDQAWAKIQRSVGIKVVVAGHSLGAARASILAGLMMLDSCTPVARYCYGEPAPGFQKLADLITPIKVSLSMRNGFGREHDLVTRVPYYIPPVFAYVHPTALVDVSAAPPADDAYGVFAWHHIELYQRAVRRWAQGEAP